MKLKITYNAPVVLTFAIVSGLLLLVDSVTNYYLSSHLFVTGRDSLLNPLTYFKMFSHVLGHASLQHYLSNMTMFLLLGPGVEEKYGSKNTLIVILFTAFVTALIQRILSPYYLMGASGVVFAFIVLSSMTSFKQGEIPLTMIIVMAYYLGMEILTGLSASDNISQSAHLVGGVCGAICGLALGPTKNNRYSL